MSVIPVNFPRESTAPPTSFPLVPIPPDGALPANYERARNALAETVKIDECRTWADKAAALASYAKQAKDDTLQKMAMRIHGRAVRRAGELLREIEPAKGGDRGNQYCQRDAADPLPSRKSAAEAAGLSERQRKTALSVAALPEEQFEEAVESDSPPTVSQLSEMARAHARAQQEASQRSPEELRAIARAIQTRIQEAGVCGPSALKLFDQMAAELKLSGFEQCAVVEALKADTPPLPTPAEAKRIAREGAPGLLVMGSDGRYHGAPADPEEQVAMERWMRLREGLEALCQLDVGPKALLAAIPPYQH